MPDLQGFYKVNAFIDETTVELTCPLPGTEIRYTTDGSMPTKESALYNGALEVGKTTDFAFRTFRPDGSPSDVVRTKYVKAPYAEAVTAPAALQPGLKQYGTIFVVIFVRILMQLLSKGSMWWNRYPFPKR